MFNRIEIQKKTGNESLMFSGVDTGIKLIDFWSWKFSDIISNTARGHFAEFIVATALKIDLSIISDDWSAFDLTSPEGIKVEVKSSAYLQTWMQKNFSKISFSIRAARSWNSITNEMAKTPSRASDVYVFCLLKHKDQATLNPMNLEQWEFYVLSTVEVNNYERSDSSITLKSLQKLTKSISYNNLRETVIRAMIRKYENGLNECSE
jgi:hypothetical protein